MIDAILFDVDGVLIDNSEENIEWFSFLCVEAGFKPPSKELISKTRNLSMRKRFELFLPDASSEQVSAILEKSKDSYADFVKFNKELAPLKKFLKELKTDYKLGIVTSRRRFTLDLVLKEFNALDFFDSIITIESTANAKPSPEPVLKALSELNCSPERAVFVGDAPTDVIAGNLARVKTVRVSSPEFTDDQFTEKPSAHITDLTELKSVINKL